VLAVHIKAMHTASLECLQKSVLPGQSLEARATNLNAAGHYSRAHAALLEALSSYIRAHQSKVGTTCVERAVTAVAP